MQNQIISSFIQRAATNAIVRSAMIAGLFAAAVLLYQFSSLVIPVKAGSCTPPPSGMVLWLPGDGNAHDISGSNNNGFEGTQTAFAAGKVAQAFQFNGNGASVVTVPDSTSLHITTALTIDAWINPSAGNSGLPSIVFKGNVNTLADQPYSLFFLPGTNQVNLRIGNNSTADAVSSNTALPLNTYTHVAATYDGATMRIYINGILDASQATNIGTLNTNDTNPVIIGSYIDGFIGAVDELEIINRALAQAEIQAIVTADSVGKCKPATPPPATACTALPAGMVAWYPAEGNANDIKGANHGTLGGQTSFAAGKVSQAFQFNGSGNPSEVTVPDSPSLHVTTALTIDAWINPTNGDAILLKGNFGSASSQPYGILVNNSTATSEQIAFSIGNNSTFDRVNSGSFIPRNVYTHITGTYDGTTMRIYVNGVLDMSKTTTIGTLNTTDTSPLRIGAGVSVPYNGAIDELEIFNRALSDTEVFNVYNAGSFGKCRTGSTFPAFPTYNVVNDFSVAGNPSPVNGGVWSYGTAVSLASAFTLYANTQTSVTGGTFSNALIDAWDTGNNTSPGVFHNTSNSAQSYSGTVNQSASQLSLQPGSYSVVRWTAPSAGEYQLQGQFQGIDSTPTTSDVYVIKNFGTPSQKTYVSGLITSNGGTVPFALNFPAGSVGETLDLVVGPGTGGGTKDSTGLTATITKISATPTVATSSISGQVDTDTGTPVSGTTVTLSGSQSRHTVTDANGAYHFENVETSGFYTVTPSRANYNFSPANRSFSILGNSAEAAFTAVADQAESANPLDTPEFFVRQQYLDFLGREPDAGGFDYWTSAITGCGADAQCRRTQRVDVSNAFFYEPEFQESGAFVYRIYKAASGQRPNFAQFQPDRAMVVGGATLDQSKSAFALAFVQRDLFRQRYPANQTAEEFVAALLNTINQNSSVDLSSQREALRALYDGTDHGRAVILRQLAENQSLVDAEYNTSFVLSQYFSYLRRDPDSSGFNFWLDQVNNAPLRDLAKQRAMVCSFITSTEYQRRFSSVVTHSNSECQ